MTQTQNKTLTIAEYREFCAQSDERYELVRGRLAKLTPLTWAHIFIADFLVGIFNAECARLQNGDRAIREGGQRTEENSARLPDVMVVSLRAIAPYLNEVALLEDAARLVVEIVSPSSAREDYTDKLREYEAKSIQEYWIVDYEALGAGRYIGLPKAPTISIYSMVDEEYEVATFRAGDRLVSAVFPALELTADQVFAAAYPNGSGESP
ncbi:Uma2 family endonuclease [Leptolyngbya sp. O-77]|uniref:Uma2 family endonuclease n=1 Tax=Leptolyngbya sp. O-77 TaxID=1080068 RepID=UPI00074D3E64|nr:Uma2 family endonuclease [Leptolyngbya sp. O-77]BAU43243.1 hypothetical protein O77CONTIG1_03070 [Leptolyngbya sp. O-77]